MLQQCGGLVGFSCLNQSRKFLSYFSQAVSALGVEKQVSSRGYVPALEAAWLFLL